jgi:hypothetical protein
MGSWIAVLLALLIAAAHPLQPPASANVADMGDRTHFHFAVFNGDMESHAWNGALPPSACSGFPAFPYRFVDPTAFIEAHLPPDQVRLAQYVPNSAPHSVRSDQNAPNPYSS